MNFKKFHESKNLLDRSTEQTGYFVKSDGTLQGSSPTWIASDYVEIEENTEYTFTPNSTAGNAAKHCFYNENKQPLVSAVIDSGQQTFTTPTGAKYVRFSYRTSSSNVMLNLGSTALPYEPYSSQVWHDIPHYIHNTSTDTITTLPAVLYPTSTTATVGLKGNTVQNGTPTPDSPIMPQGCGELETIGEKAGQYKIPISSASTTTPIHLGEVQTTRRVEKLVLTGLENWAGSKIDSVWRYYIRLSNSMNVALCTHYKWLRMSGGTEDHFYLTDTRYLYIFSANLSTVEDFKAYLAAQYAAGTPVTVWYVLTTEETAVVNEPLMKIGNYADEVSNVSIPVTAGGDTLSVGTTVQPSEVTVNYKGWHPVADVHERANGAWT